MILTMDEPQPYTGSGQSRPPVREPAQCGASASNTTSLDRRTVILSDNLGISCQSLGELYRYVEQTDAVSVQLDPRLQETWAASSKRTATITASMAS